MRPPMHKEKQSTVTQPSEKKNGEWYFSNFKKFEDSLNGESTSHVHAIRTAAMERLAKVGLPTTRDEEWRFTNIQPIAGGNFQPVLHYSLDEKTRNNIQKNFIAGLTGSRLVFVNGHFAKELSLLESASKDMRVESLASALQRDPNLVNQYLTRYARYEENPFTALNMGFLHDGAYVFIPDQIVLAAPIYLVFVATELELPFVSHPRNLIVAGKNSHSAFVEHYLSLGENTYFTNAVTEVVMAENAIIEHVKLQDESARAFHVGSMYIHQRKSSNITSHAISFGGALVRNNVNAILDEEGCECTLNGLSLTTGTQHIDNHTTIDHMKPHCNSHELYKAILDGKSKGVFNGKILVRKDAQKTDAKQTNKTLLLSDNATMHTKPQLEIFADDVKCTHGATVGYLDAEALFYLRSRGIGLDAARDLLTYAFASDVTGRISVEPLREHLSSLLHAQLEQGRESGKL